MKDLSKVPMWRLELDSNLRPSGCKALNLTLSYHAPDKKRKEERSKRNNNMSNFLTSHVRLRQPLRDIYRTEKSATPRINYNHDFDWLPETICKKSRKSRTSKSIRTSDEGGMDRPNTNITFNRICAHP